MLHDVYSNIRFHSTLEKIQSLPQKKLLKLYQFLRKQYERQKRDFYQMKLKFEKI